jgi:predicted phage tail protein
MMLSTDELKRLIGHDAEVESVQEKEFDPRGQYNGVLEAVKSVGNGKVGVFRVVLGGTRSEYYVVSVDEKEGRVVGLKALAVES